MAENNIDIIEAYMKFFKDKADETDLVKSFVKDYRQKQGGYIKCANDFINLNNNKNITNDDNRKYYEYLKDQTTLSGGKTNIEILSEKTSISPDNILNPTNEPNQKWHLLISYLGMKLSQGKQPCFGLVSCPELWLWMFDASGEFSKRELSEIYNRAIDYKNGNKKGWINFLFPYRKALHNIIIQKYKD